MRRKLTNITIVLLATFLTLGIAECIMRLNGFKASTPRLNVTNQPVMMEYDSILGWKNLPGNYVYPPYSSKVTHDIQVSFQQNGFRKTSSNNHIKNEGMDKIIFIGGSFIMGQAINDSETVAWKVQGKFPKFKIVNCGVGAYGTYQSLLSLERNLPQMDSVKFVFYGLLDHHLQRNIAIAGWLDILSVNNKINQITVPYVSLENGQLKRHKPKHYNHIPLGSDFAFTKLIERRVFNFNRRISNTDQERILILLLQEMEKLIKANGAELVVIGFNLKKSYLELLDQNEFSVVDCQWDDSDSSNIVIGEGHPNGKVNTLWAREVEKYLKFNLK